MKMDKFNNTCLVNSIYIKIENALDDYQQNDLNSLKNDLDEAKTTMELLMSMLAEEGVTDELRDSIFREFGVNIPAKYSNEEILSIWECLMYESEQDNDRRS